MGTKSQSHPTEIGRWYDVSRHPLSLSLSLTLYMMKWWYEEKGHDTGPHLKALADGLPRTPPPNLNLGSFNPNHDSGDFDFDFWLHTWEMMPCEDGWLWAPIRAGFAFRWIWACLLGLWLHLGIIYWVTYQMGRSCFFYSWPDPAQYI